MVKTGAVAGLTAGLFSLVIVIPLIVINSKVDEKEVEKRCYKKIRISYKIYLMNKQKNVKSEIFRNTGMHSIK